MNTVFRQTRARACRHSYLSLTTRTSSILAKIAAPSSSHGSPEHAKHRDISVRYLSQSSAHLTQAATQTVEARHPEQPLTEDPFVYNGPLTSAFRRLKLFSLGSLGLSTALSPFIFLIDSNLPMNARIALAGIALGTSGLSTGLVSWCAKPYVTVMHRFRPENTGGAEEVEMTTFTLTLQPRFTRVYDPSFLIETRRPLAKWELAQKISLTRSRTDAVGSNVHPNPGTEETVAETRNAKGDVLGRWVVRWEEGGVGTCHEAGNMVRYFNVHEELLK